MIEIWTDGSNAPGKHGGCSAIVCTELTRHDLSVRLPIGTTNNQAELNGIKLGLEFVLRRYGCHEKTRVYTDSSYCKGTLNWSDFTKTWEFWINKNFELVDEIRALTKKFDKFEIQLVKGHRPEEFPLNEIADILAKKAARFGICSQAN